VARRNGASRMDSPGGERRDGPAAVCTMGEDAFIPQSRFYCTARGREGEGKGIREAPSGKRRAKL